MTFPTVNLAQVVAPAFYPVHRDIKAGRHTHYWLKGGRGSTKSSFASVEIILGIMQHSGTHAVCYRKVKDTLKDSVFAQLLWAIDTLGVTHLWRSTESPMRLIYMPTQQQILFRGLDRAKKSKSIKPKSGYFRYIWFEELDEFTGMEEIRTVMQSVMRGGERFCCFCTYNPPKSQRNWVNTEVVENTPDRFIHHSDYRSVPPDWLGEQFVIEAEHLRDTRPELYAHEYLGEVTGTGTEVFQNLAFREITDEEIKRFAELNRGLDFGYSGDPLHYTVNHYDSARRKLYIFHELHALRMSNMVLAENILSEMSLHGGGRVDRLDAATRRAALTGISQTAGKISLARAQQMGARFMELTAHAGARPSHAAWQGQVVSLEGAPGYLSLDDIGYGTGDGFKGWNCRHDWFPFFPGLSSSAYPRDELERLNNATVPHQGKDVPVYEAMQKQRAMERKIRESKREVSALDAARQTNTKLNLDADFNRAAMELKRREAALKDYLKETGLNRDRSREQVHGFGRSQSSKAVWANRKELEKYAGYRYNKSGTIIVTDDWKIKAVVSIPRQYKPFAVIETIGTKGGVKQVDRTLYDKNGVMIKQLHSGSHGNPKLHPYGIHGEHAHDYQWLTEQKNPQRNTRKLTEEERKEISDIL